MGFYKEKKVLEVYMKPTYTIGAIRQLAYSDECEFRKTEHTYVRTRTYVWIILHVHCLKLQLWICVHVWSVQCSEFLWRNSLHSFLTSSIAKRLTEGISLTIDHVLRYPNVRTSFIFTRPPPLGKRSDFHKYIVYIEVTKLSCFSLYFYDLFCELNL